jgi:hypothetical protein
MKRHGTYTEIFRNDRWAIFKAQGGLNQVLAKNTITTETHAFARYTHKPAFFAETGTPHNWLPAYVRARVAKALGCCDTNRILIIKNSCIIKTYQNIPCEIEEMGLFEHLREEFQ